MAWLETATLIFNLIFCLPTIASLTTFDAWWVRGFDFPRVQISILIFLNVILALFVYDFGQNWHFVLSAVLVAGLVYQCYLIYPYTILAKKQVIDYLEGDATNNVSILVSNVLTENRNYEALRTLIRDKNPDVLLTLETDKKWETALNTIENDYKFTVKVPLDNLYGMHLYSKLRLHNTEVRYLISDDIPSIHGEVELKNGERVHLHCLHPRPPSPSESDTSTKRDAELLVVAREIEMEEGAVLAFGDFNDVAWSKTTRLFQKISRLLDPRRGRGFYNTYNANYRLLRWPLDHVFHTDNFTLKKLERARHIGSDHFPMYIELNYCPKAEILQEAPEADASDKEWADEKIIKGKTEL